jgi:hypothetical protein
MSVDNGDTNAKQLRLNNTAASGTNTSGIEFSSLGFVKASIDAAVYGDGYMTFSTNNNSEKMRITAGGSVGIGTSSPSSPLTINASLSAPQFEITRSEQTNQGFTINAGGGNVTFDSIDGTGVVNGRYIFNSTIGSTTTERMRIDSTGNVGIGTSSPGAILDVGKANNAGDVDFRFFNRGAGSTNSSVTIGMYPTNSSIRGGEIICFADNPGSGQFSMRFLTSNTTAVPSERMRIDRSGNVLIGKTAADVTTNGFSVEPAGTTFMTRGDNRPLILNRQSSTGSICDFRQASTTVGTVSVTGSGTTYNTTSDIRLKTDIEPIDHATDMLMAMNPVSHRWKADPDADAVVGFIAQEMQEIVPEAVSGDADSDEMMSMDYGRITPVLVAALQDAHKKIEALEARIANLEVK